MEDDASSTSSPLTDLYASPPTLLASPRTLSAPPPTLSASPRTLSASPPTLSASPTTISAALSLICLSESESGYSSTAVSPASTLYSPRETTEEPPETSDDEAHRSPALSKLDGLQVNAQEQQEDENVREKVINEEYKTWKKNAPFLYDILLSTALDWPTLTTQWFPDKQAHPDKDFSTHRLLIGTHTSSEAPNYLQIAHVQLPNPAKADAADYDEEREEIGGYGQGSKEGIKFNIVQKIDHPGEVNKARYMPQNPNLIATMCIDGRVMVWDKTKHTSIPTGNPAPQMELLGHKKEGFGLSWSTHNEGHLVTGSEDSTVRLWNITDYSKTSKSLSPTKTYTHHSAIVNDVEYHPKFGFLVGTVSDDLTVQILDTRKASTTTSALQGVNGHEDAINAISFNPASEFLFATASADNTVGIWDLRSMDKKLHSLEGHHDAVTSLAWHPFEESILGSASYDRRIIFWDLSKIGDEQMPDDQEDGPPELMFMHGGHTNHMSDFSWNLNDPWVVCSAAEDNLIQVWRVANSIVARDADDLPTDELTE